MSAPSETATLSAMARARQQALLPTLLQAVRQRRNRRKALRAAAAVMFVAGLAALLWQPWRADRTATPDPVQPTARAPSWSTFGNDPTTVARYAVATTSRAEWFVDDDGLNTLLDQAGRRSGIVRAGGRVEVNRAAIDPWPASGDE